jgi:hypothetical protein
MAIWQITGGLTEGSFTHVFLDHAVVLIGPGDAGAWHPGRADAEYNGANVRWLAAEMQMSDLILLRTGRATVHAVGIVASDYLYLPQFDDVNGWDLQHGRRVRWCRLAEPYTFGSSVFGGGPAQLAQVNHPELVDLAQRVIQSPPFAWQSTPLPSLPEEEPALYNPPAAVADLVAHAADLNRLYWDVVLFGESPAEHEMVAHYVVPLLRALGWQVEQIALEWRRIDVALFHHLPRSPANCHFIVEAKRLGVGVEGHLQQAKDYLLGLGIRRDIIVTDGLRYRLYAADQDYAPVAYANLARLKQSSLSLFERMKRP